MRGFTHGFDVDEEKWVVTRHYEYLNFPRLLQTTNSLGSLISKKKYSSDLWANQKFDTSDLKREFQTFV